MLSAYRNLPRNIWLLGAISLLNDSASELVYPLLPLYLSTVLLASPRALGLMEGIAEALAALMKLASGVLSDRFASRKWPMLLGYSVPAVVRPAFAFASSAFGVLLLRVADRLGKALRSAPRDALLANSVSAEQRGLAFGVHRAMDHLGAVIGPILAWLLIASGASIEQALLGAIVPGIACVLLASQVTEIEAPVTNKKPSFDWRWQGLPKVFRRYLIALTFFSLGNSSNMFLLLQAKQVGISTADILLCWALMNLIATLLTPSLTQWSDRIGRLPLLRGGWAFYVLIYLLFAGMTGSLALLLFGFAAMGLFMAATEGVEKALVADLLDKRQAGSAFGWFYLASGLPLLPASYFFGELMTQVSAGSAFIFSACCVAIGIALLPSSSALQLSGRNG